MRLGKQQREILTALHAAQTPLTQAQLIERRTGWPAHGRTGGFRHSTLDRKRYSSVRGSLSNSLRRLEEQGLVVQVRRYPATHALTATGRDLATNLEVE